MMQWHYRYAGLRIASELPIPEWSVFEQNDSAFQTDVRILLKRSVTETTAETSENDAPHNDYRFSIPEAGEYRIRNGCEIIVSPAPAAGEKEIRLFLLGSAWSALCYQRVIPAMHASVVLTSAGAVAFCGAPGAGKSTMAAWLVDRGYALIGDDLCCFDVTSDVPQVYPSMPHLKLWNDALETLGLNSRGLSRDLFRAEKFILDLTAWGIAVLKNPIPLRAICVLEWGNMEMTRLKGMNALRRLVASATYRASFIDAMGKTGVYWEQCAKLARTTSIWKLQRPRNRAAREAVVGRFAEKWQAAALDKPCFRNLGMSPGARSLRKN